MQPWHKICVLDGLAASEVVKPDGLLVHKYRNWCMEHPAGEEFPLSMLSMEELAECSAAAVVVLTRTPEDYRPELTRQETDMLRTVCASFERTVLVLNTPGYMELGELAQCVPAIVFMGIAGQEGGCALADLLTARVMPSGRLAHSWPVTLSQFDEAAQALDRFIGYRWFDSFGRDVLYPFGYGLGYGKAELTSVSMGLDGCDVVVTAEVENTGETYPVQEVVQVYFSTPDSERGACWQLDCFQKTRPLDPGEKQVLTLRFPVTEMAVFRESASAFVLEEGYYDIRVGTSSRSTYVAGSLRLTRSAVVQAITPMQMPAVSDRPRRVRASPILRSRRSWLPRAAVPSASPTAISRAGAAERAKPSPAAAPTARSIRWRTCAVAGARRSSSSPRWMTTACASSSAASVRRSRTFPARWARRPRWSATASRSSRSPREARVLLCKRTSATRRPTRSSAVSTAPRSRRQVCLPARSTRS